MIWICKRFDGLTAHELYGILRLRCEVFIVEQSCVYQDLDGRDAQSSHLFALDCGEVVACARIVPPGVRFPECSVGRLVTHKSYRRQGIGRETMLRATDEAWRMFGRQPIRISAQAYLRDFYESLGFRAVSELYLEDGIPHYEMLCELPTV